MSLKKPLEIVADRSNWWRIRLLTVRKFIDTKAHKVSPAAFTRALDSLLRDASEYPMALLPTTRQLRRLGQTALALNLTEEIWDNQATESAAWSLACATVWYDNHRVWRGDLALEQAKSLEPDWAPIFEEQARNQRWRGNYSVTIEAAQRAAEIHNDTRGVSEWEAFQGMEHFKAHRFDKAIESFERSLPRRLSPAESYALALSLEKTGRTHDADVYYRAAEKKFRRKTASDLLRARTHYAYRQFSAALNELPTTDLRPDALLIRAKVFIQMGDLEAVIEAVSADSNDRDLLQIRALALELQERFAAAADAYKRLCASPTVKPGDSLLLRFARAAYLASDFSSSAQASFTYAGKQVRNLRKLENEVDPVFPQLVSVANDAIKRGDLSEARTALVSLSRSVSSPLNVRQVFNTLASVEFKLGDLNEAAKNFYIANPFKQPAAREADPAPPAPTRRTEYAEMLNSETSVQPTILYESFHGAKTACNPLAICQALIEDKRGVNLHHVWAIRDGADIHPSLLNRPNVSFVRIGSLGYLLHLATASYTVNNSTFPTYYTRPEGQRYVNTWHGVPWKTLGNEIIDSPFSFGNVARNFRQATDLLFPDTHTAEVLVRTQDLRNALPRDPEIIGSPRIDITLNLNGSSVRSLKSGLQLDPHKPTVFYAPTWRGTMDSMELVASSMVHAIQTLAELDVNLVVRVHHFVSASLDGELPVNVRIAPDTIDTNELLAIADVLVSDYSSLIFDYATLQRPIVKYVFDHVEYVSSRGLYFTIDDVPGVSCENLTELFEAVTEALNTINVPRDWSSCTTGKVWQNEDGKATGRALDIMFAPLPDRAESSDGRRKFLISLGGLNPNGITRSIRSLLGTFSQTDEEIRLFISNGVLSNPIVRETALELHQNAQFTIHGGLGPGSRQERHAWSSLRNTGRGLSTSLTQALRNWMQRERRRHFGDFHFDTVLDFDGYGLYPTALTALGFPDRTKNRYLLHSEFMNELRTRFPALISIGPLLKHFSAAATVSENAAVTNSKELAAAFDVPPELISALPNTINVSEIRDLGNAELDADLRDWFGRPGTHVVVVGRLSVEKNHHGAIHALKILHSAGQNVRFTLVGHGPRLHALKELTRELGLGDFVYFAGQRDNPYPAIKAADLLLHPSTYEGQSLVLLEAMTLGTPAIATRIPGSTAVLEDGRLGELTGLAPEDIAEGLRKGHSGELNYPTFEPEKYLTNALNLFRAFMLTDPDDSSVSHE